MKRKSATTQPISIGELQRLMYALSNALANSRLQSRYIGVALAEHHLQQDPGQLAIYLSGIAGEVGAILSFCESRLLDASSKSESELTKELEAVAGGIEALIKRSAESRRAKKRSPGILDELTELAERQRGG